MHKKFLTVLLVSQLIALFLGSSAIAESSGDPLPTDEPTATETAPNTSSKAIRETRLRASKPNGTFSTSRGATKLKRVDVKVRNAGEAVANDVVVRITSPAGKSYTASGPTSLAARAEATYTTNPGDYVTSTKRIKVEVSCSNCYR